jgi:regulatory protein
MNQSAYQYSLYLLSRQDYSEHKLRQKLKFKQFETKEIDETISKLISNNYLREEEYKRLLARRWILKGYSDSLIKRKGEQEKLSFEQTDLDSWREELGTNKEVSIQTLVDKKMRGKDIPTDRESLQKLKNKVSRFLISKGYGFDDVRRAVDLAMRPQE